LSRGEVHKVLESIRPDDPESISAAVKRLTKTELPYGDTPDRYSLQVDGNRINEVRHDGVRQVRDGANAIRQDPRNKQVDVQSGRSGRYIHSLASFRWLPADNKVVDLFDEGKVHTRIDPESNVWVSFDSKANQLEFRVDPLSGEISQLVLSNGGGENVVSERIWRHHDRFAVGTNFPREAYDITYSNGSLKSVFMRFIDSVEFDAPVTDDAFRVGYAKSDVVVDYRAGSVSEPHRFRAKEDGHDVLEASRSLPPIINAPPDPLSGLSSRIPILIIGNAVMLLCVWIFVIVRRRLRRTRG
jgi:hypothetical protein